LTRASSGLSLTRFCDPLTLLLRLLDTPCIDGEAGVHRLILQSKAPIERMSGPLSGSVKEEM